MKFLLFLLLGNIFLCNHMSLGEHVDVFPIEHPIPKINSGLGLNIVGAATFSTLNPSLELQVFNLVNSKRASGAICGGKPMPVVPPLKLNQLLTNAARNHSLDMAVKNYFSHVSLDGRTFVNRISSAGYTSYRALGENIAAGYNTASSVMNGWMTSPGHCNNIMSPNYKEIGIGYAFDSTSTYDHYWTQDFGTRF